MNINVPGGFNGVHSGRAGRPVLCLVIVAGVGSGTNKKCAGNPRHRVEP